MMTVPAPSPFAPLVLVVDDDEDARAVARGMLHIIGYRTRAVSSGEEALRAVQSERPAAILLDLHMPGLDGLGFLDRAAQRVPQFEGIPVFVASGVYRDAEHLARPLMRRRVWAFLQKPFSLGALREGMRDFLDLVPPHPGDPRSSRSGVDGGPLPKGAVVLLSSPGLSVAAVAQARALAAARDLAFAAPTDALVAAVEGTMGTGDDATKESADEEAAATRRAAHHPRPCEFAAALFCAGAVIPCFVQECGPETIEVHRPGAPITVGERTILRAQVEADDGQAFFDLRVRAVAIEARGPMGARVTTLRLEPGAAQGSYGDLLDWLASRAAFPLARASAPAGDPRFTEDAG